MTFGTLSVTWVLVGIAGLAGILYLLQRLRVQHREVQVPTTLFWKEAVEEARARVLVHRFRHPWAWALLVLICALLWLGVADVRGGDGDDAKEHLVLIDGSAAMARGERFAQAAERTLELVADLPSDRRTVVLCGGTPRTVLYPGEHVELLRERLGGVIPEACPSTVARQLGAFGALRRERELSVAVISDFPQLPPEDLWGEGVTVAVSRSNASVAANSGIVEIGVAEAASGAYDAVDVRVEVVGAGSEPPRVTLDGVAYEGAWTEQPAAADARAFVIRDLAAAGQRLEARLTGDDALALDDVGAVRLPVRRRIRVALQSELPSLRRVLSLDPAVELVTDTPDVIVGVAVGNAAVPTLELTNGADQEEAFLLQHDTAQDSTDVVTAALTQLGLDQIDAMGLAREAARPIALGARPGTVRKVMVWGELFSEDYDFTRSRAFPIFMARTVRWLSGESGFPRHVTAGQEAAEATAVRDASGRRHDPVGRPWTPAAAGEFATDAGTTWSAALSAPAASLGLATAGDLPTAEAGGDGVDWVAWVGLAVLGLLSCEWFLFRRGRMP